MKINSTKNLKLKTSMIRIPEIDYSSFILRLLEEDETGLLKHIIPNGIRLENLNLYAT